MNADQIQRWLDKNKKFGELELTEYVSNSKQIKVYQGRPDSMSMDREQAAAIRVWNKGRMGFSYTEKLSEEALDLALAIANEHLDLASADPFEAPPIFSSIQSTPPAHTLNPDDINLKSLLEQILTAEDNFKKCHPSIFNVDNCAVEITSKSYMCHTANGSFQIQRGGLYSYVSVLARQNQVTDPVNPDAIRYWPTFEQIEWQTMYDEIAEECARRIIPGALLSGNIPVLFHPRAGRTILKRFESVFSGDAVADGLSLFKNKIGSQVAAHHVSLIDDAAQGPAFRHHDAEGTLAKKISLIKNGELQSFLHNQYTAKKLGMPQTGHAVRELKIPRAVKASNFYLAGGSRPWKSLLADLDKSVMITDLTGASASPVSGDFSFGALGHLIINGKISGFINNFTVAGNFFTLLKSIDEIAAEVFFDPPELWSATGSPYFIAKDLTLAA